jgi:hypothetical protein
MNEDKNEYLKFVDSAVRTREKESSIASLRSALFWAVLGPAALGVIKLTSFTPPKWILTAILGTIPFSLILLVFYFLRIPGEFKTSPTVLSIAFLTLLAAGATLFLRAA